MPKHIIVRLPKTKSSEMRERETTGTEENGLNYSRVLTGSRESRADDKGSSVVQRKEPPAGALTQVRLFIRSEQWVCQGALK